MSICEKKSFDESALLVKNLFKFCKEGPLCVAMQAVDHSTKQGIQIPADLFMCVINGCIKKKDVVVGRQVHSLIIKNELTWNSKLRCRLIVMFSSWGDVVSAVQVFQSVQEQNTYTWTAIISAHAQNGLGEQAMTLYKQMQIANVKPNEHTFVGVIKACASVGALDQGKIIHFDSVEHSLFLDLFVGGVLIDMYAKCGTLRDARYVFDNLPVRDVVVWSAMIAGYAQHGDGLEALLLFERMLHLGIAPTRVTFVCSLKACATAKAIHEGKLIHAKVTKQKIETDLIVGNVLIDMYAKCRRLEDALRVFNFLSVRDAVSWNTLIAGYLDEECYEEALDLSNRMQEKELEPNNATWLNLLKLFAGIQDLQGVHLVHLDSLFQKVDLDVHLQNTLVDVYAKCGSLSDACKVFFQLRVQDIVSWNTMLAGYVDHQLPDVAIGLFLKMVEGGTEPDRVTFIAVLKACISLETSKSGKLVHALILRQGQETDPFVVSTLIDMYAKCQCIEDACCVFNNLSIKNVVSWNAIITGYSDCGFPLETLGMFVTMLNEGVEPSRLTSLAVLKACSSLAVLDYGRLIHFEVVKEGYHSDSLVGNSLIGFYSKCGRLEDAQKVFDTMTAQDVVSCSALLSGYADHGYGEKAMHLFDAMQRKAIEPNKVTFLGLLKACTLIGTFKDGKLIHRLIMRHGLDTDSSIGSTLIDMYAKCGSVIDAHKVFNKLQSPNVVCYSAIIGGYADHGHGEEALKLLDDMKCDGLEPNEVTFLSVLKACAGITSLNHAKLVHADIIEQGLESNRSVGSTLLDMYAKCGSLENALYVFENVRVKDVVSWNAIIGGYADHGHLKVAHAYYERMLENGIWPNDVTFVCLLMACSHTGLFDECFKYLKSMIDYYGIEPTIQHYACLIDMYSRAGCLERAEEILSKLPFKPNSVVYLSLLGACAKFKNLEIGQRVFDCLSKSGFQSPSGHVLMSNIYVSNQVWEDVEEVVEATSF